jgi:threonine aldolase
VRPGGAGRRRPADLIAQARAWRHRYGGRIFQQWPAALAALTGLDTQLPRLPEYVRHARMVATALAQAPGARVHPDPPHTHQFQWWLPYGAEALEEAALGLADAERTWLCAGWTQIAPGYAMVEITVAEPALTWTVADVNRAVEAFLGRVAG